MDNEGNHLTPPRLKGGIFPGQPRCLAGIYVRYKSLFINIIAKLSFLVALTLIGGRETASAKHADGLKAATMPSLMSDMKVQALKPVPLPAFTLPDIFDQPFKIKDQVGKVILINFWTTY